MVVSRRDTRSLDLSVGRTGRYPVRFFRPTEANRKTPASTWDYVTPFDCCVVLKVAAASERKSTKQEGASDQFRLVAWLSMLPPAGRRAKVKSHPAALSS